MKFILKSSFLCLSIMFFLIACKEDEKTEPSDKQLPSISKISPQAHQEYAFGDTAFFRINFSDNDKLQEVSLKLTLITDEVLLFTQKFPNANSSSIDTFIIMNDLRYSNVDYEIKAIDVSGNVSLQSSHIHLH